MESPSAKLPTLSTPRGKGNPDLITNKSDQQGEPVDIDTKTKQLPLELQNASNFLKRVHNMISTQTEQKSLEDKNRNFLIQLHHQLKNFELLWKRDQDQEKMKFDAQKELISILKIQYEKSNADVQSIRDENQNLRKKLRKMHSSCEMLTESKNSAIKRLDQMLHEANANSYQLSDQRDQLASEVQKLKISLLNSTQEVTYLRSYLSSLEADKNYEIDTLTDLCERMRRQMTMSESSRLTKLRRKLKERKRKLKKILKDIGVVERKLEHREKTSLTYYKRTLKLEGELSDLYKKLEKYEKVPSTRHIKETPKEHSPTSQLDRPNTGDSSKSPVKDKRESRKRRSTENDESQKASKIQKTN